MNRDELRSTKTVLGEIYNSPAAERNFTNIIPDVKTRANFFGAQNLYEQSNAGSGVRWFGGAETVTKAPIVGLGGGGLLGDLAFRSSELAGVPTVEWRKEAGDKLMKNGFVNFKNLFNSGTSDPVAWDINQLRSEQKGLQGVHVKYLSDHTKFQTLSRVLTNSDSMSSTLLRNFDLIDDESLISGGG